MLSTPYMRSQTKLYKLVAFSSLSDHSYASSDPDETLSCMVARLRQRNIFLYFTKIDVRNFLSQKF